MCIKFPVCAYTHHFPANPPSLQEEKAAKPFSYMAGFEPASPDPKSGAFPFRLHVHCTQMVFGLLPFYHLAW